MKDPDRIGVYVLDVGQGDCTIILLPDDRAVVFDCRDDLVLRKVLDSWKVRTIEAFVLSHLVVTLPWKMPTRSMHSVSG